MKDFIESLMVGISMVIFGLALAYVGFIGREKIWFVCLMSACGVWFGVCGLKYVIKIIKRVH